MFTIPDQAQQRNYVQISLPNAESVFDFHNFSGAAVGPAAGQALAAWRRLNEMTGLGTRQAPADPAAPQPQAPEESAAWAPW